MADSKLPVPMKTTDIGAVPGHVWRAAFRPDMLFAIGIIGILTVLLLPVPTWLLDLLLAFSITTAVLILMTVLFIERPLDLSSFPTILLISTLLRLSLNIASTRLILSQGHEGSAAAGKVIEAFGHFVMSGSIVIGLIVFGILTIINFVVITKGSGRIAEVAARFNLDAMPGKQMAIDADLSAGLINEQDARDRRKRLEDENTFYGSMDGANKFVRGDAIAGLLITFINLIGGMIIGVAQRDMEFSEAVHVYTVLTIGDGLVSQVPAIIVSIAAGMLVTKAGVSGSADRAVIGQLGNLPQALGLSSALLFCLGLVPGIPGIPFWTLSGITGFAAWHSYRAQEKLKDETAAAGGAPGSAASGVPGQPGAAAQPAEEAIGDTLKIDTLRLEMGYGLLPLINYEKGHRLTEQIKALRKQLAKELGFILPPVRIQDNMQLPANTYLIMVKDTECGRGDIRPDMLLVMDPTGARLTLPGEETHEPTFGLPAMWVAHSYREEALFRNYTVVDPPTVVTTHITEIIKENMSELLSYTETQKLLDELDKEHQKLLADTIPSQITVTGVQRVLQRLLAERISIRDLPTIMEAIADASRRTQNVLVIAEHVRARMARQLSFAAMGGEGYIPIITLSPSWEQQFAESISGQGEEQQLAMPPSKIQEFIKLAAKVLDEQATRGESPVILTSPIIRPFVRSVIERFRPSVGVMSQSEIHPKVKIKTLGQIG
jgi:flagellar biosynthesis protein FlhA